MSRACLCAKIGPRTSLSHTQKDQVRVVLSCCRSRSGTNCTFVSALGVALAQRMTLFSSPGPAVDVPPWSIAPRPTLQHLVRAVVETSATTRLTHDNHVSRESHTSSSLGGHSNSPRSGHGLTSSPTPEETRLHGTALKRYRVAWISAGRVGV